MVSLSQTRPHATFASLTYSLGDFVTDQGSVWHCKVNQTRSRPSGDPVLWTLAVKKRARRQGRDLTDQLMPADAAALLLAWLET